MFHRRTFGRVDCGGGADEVHREVMERSMLICPAAIGRCVIPVGENDMSYKSKKETE